MENLKHTKGEWEVTQMLNVTSKESGKMICATQSNMDGHEIEANAKLISATPDLLEALIKVTRTLEFINTIDNVGQIKEVIQISKNAINKATK